MNGRVGESFVGVVNAVVPFGLFVELEGLYIEGLVHISGLKNDYYKHEPAQHRLRGERSGRIYGLGQKMRVKVVRVNLDERKIDLEPLEDLPGGRAPARAPERDRGRGGARNRPAGKRGGGRGRR
jgi:ribonuclease R